jgi:hypothetical protein
MKCPVCDNEENVIKCGRRHNKDGVVQRYKCTACGVKFVEHPLKHQTVTYSGLLVCTEMRNHNCSWRQIASVLPGHHATVWRWYHDYVVLCNVQKNYKRTFRCHNCGWGLEPYEYYIALHVGYRMELCSAQCLKEKVREIGKLPTLIGAGGRVKRTPQGLGTIVIRQDYLNTLLL